MPAFTIATSSIVRRAARRRWWLVLAGSCGLLLFQIASGTGVRWNILAEYVALGSVATLVFEALARRGVKGMAAAISSLLLDLLLAVIPAALLDLPGLGGLALVAMLPYAETEEGVFGFVAAAAAGLGLLIGHALVDQQTGLPTGPVVTEAVLVIVLTFGLRSAGQRRAGRIEALRHAAERAAAGDFSALAEQLAASVEHLERAASELSGASGRLARDLQAQRSVAEANRQQTEGAAHEAGEQRQRALLLADESVRLVTVADRARQSVARASETLVAVAAKVSTTAGVVNELTAMSARIGGFTATISAIARQTHLLSLNAAIEAARAEAEGQGFGVVAEEVRTLAAQAGRSAREVSELVGELQEGIGGAARAMSAGQQQVEDVARVAREADEGLRELADGVRRSSDRVSTLAVGTRTQADHLESLRSALEQVSKTSAGAASSSDGAARAATQQSQAVQELARTAQQLAGLAERLRAAVAK